MSKPLLGVIVQTTEPTKTLQRHQVDNIGTDLWPHIYTHTQTHIYACTLVHTQQHLSVWPEPGSVAKLAPKH